MSLYERIKEGWEWLVEVAKTIPWLRFRLGGLIGAVGGSTFLGFVNRYAMYNYSVVYGGRLPVEGVPYLDFAVSVLSFAFLFISLFSLICVYLFLMLLTRWIRKFFQGEWHSRLKDLVASFISVLAFAVGLVSAIPAVEGTLRIFGIDRPVHFATPDTATVVLFIVAIFAVSVILIACTIWPERVRWFACS